jgi:hypothetical protein
MSHPLIDRAKRGSYREKPEMPAEARYDESSGLWIAFGASLARNADPKQQTKKFDVETGEDQKGE